MKSMRARVSLCLVVFCLMALAVWAEPADSKVMYQSGSFPPAGVDTISHKVTIGLYTVDEEGKQGKLLENLEFSGRMLIERGDPYVNGAGYRQVAFTVKNWEAYTWSNTLNSMVVYSLADDVPQKISTITAQQKESDYPARFRFIVTFHATAFGQRITDEPYEGEPQGEGFMEVPPSGNRRTSPLLSKFEATRIAADHPTLGRIMFVPVACGDEEGSTLVTYTNEQKKTLRLPQPVL